MDDINKEISRLKNLKNYRKKDKSELEKIARKNVWTKALNLSERFANEDDKNFAKERLDYYLTNNIVESFSDAQDVADLVFEETLKYRVEKVIDTILSGDNKKFIPQKDLDSLHNIQTRITELKNKIGVSSSEKKDDLTALQELEKKFKTFITFNRNEFTLFAGYKCSGCGKEDVQPLLLRRRVKNFEALKHPIFSGRFLFNIPIIDDVEAGKITKEQAAKYLFTSPKYIEWAIENRHKIVEIEDVSQEEVNEFIDNNPHLGKSTDYYENDN